MRKSLLVGVGLGVVMLIGAGCNSSNAPVATSDKAAVESPSNVSKLVALPMEVGTEEEMDHSLPNAERKPDPNAPVQFVMLKNADEYDTELRFRATVKPGKNIKMVNIFYRCVDEKGETSKESSTGWGGVGPEAKPILAGQTYEDTLPMSVTSVRCPMIRATDVTFADDTEWSWGIK
ncbi:MAG: hypothetical protein EXS55_03860 [Candidatus Magasanikbacteria bacterium]|nr:hypothetical protein [Candidatus Magasanikbacteria bacterium]